MHFLHIVHFFFKWRGKGKYVFPILFFSFLLMTIIFEGFNIWTGLEHNRIFGRMFMCGAFFLAAALNFLVTKNYIIRADGEIEILEEEGSYIYIKVSIWTKVFIVFGMISLLGILADMLFITRY